jgi:Protein of unknown function (DUF1493)
MERRPMQADLSISRDDIVFRYLRELGHSEQHIARMSKDTRLFHDLRIYGDSALEDLEILQERFGVDLSEFEFGKYFPPQFEGSNKLEAFILTSIPFASMIVRRRRTYLPLTLEMINRAIRAKRWVE